MELHGWGEMVKGKEGGERDRQTDRQHSQGQPTRTGALGWQGVCFSFCFLPDPPFMLCELLPFCP